MHIAILCVTNYYSGTAEQFFKSAIESLGHKVTIVSMDEPGAEGKVLSQKNDILLHIPYPDKFRQEIMRAITKNGKTVTLGWMGDDEWLWNSNAQHSPKFIANDYSYCITTSRDSLKNYESIGCKNVILSQWGYSAKDWKRSKAKKEIDVYFCGAKSEERDFYIQKLMEEKINIVVDGLEYGVSSYDKFYRPFVQEKGEWVKSKLSFDEMAKRTGMAKIALNFNFGVRDGKLYEQIKQRMFEIPATGTFQLAYGANEVGRYFKPGVEIDTFRSPSEMVKKINYYLKHEKEREQIARKGYVTNKVNSYEKIFKKIFEEI